MTSEAAEQPARPALALQVHNELVTLECDVHEVADQHAGEQASIILGVVMNARGPSRSPFEAEQLPLSGAVHLLARAAKGRASCGWQYSTDSSDRAPSGPT